MKEEEIPIEVDAEINVNVVDEKKSPNYFECSDDYKVLDNSSSIFSIVVLVYAIDFLFLSGGIGSMAIV